ncbi:MAG: class I tRNA ligase family protein, partial [Patescibacteria group bacterium]
MLIIQDIMSRHARMEGKKTLWLPGTDHAAIATQSKVEKLLEKEGVRKNDLGREKFIERVEKFAKESHDTIVNQCKKMGASLDWSREAFTLDEKRNLAVKTTFKTMYDDGLIYRGHRIVNWDPKGQTVISDDELVYEEKKSKFYTFKYGPFEIGTTRPETKFGDKYVVMHPDDKRYKKYTEGQKIKLEWINGPIEATVVKDKVIDMEFGTGVMTITPWHTSIDFDIAERHKLDKEQIIDKYGKLLPIAQEFAGMKISDAREKIVEKLKIKGLLVSVNENYVNRVATAERTGGIIEPQIMLQWFVDVNKKIPSRNNKSLKELMLEPVHEGKIKIIPNHFEKVYFNWIENLRDWCISRQIWYGHRIPVWYHEPRCIPKKGREEDVSKCIETIVALEKPTCSFCDAKYIQDEDTLDTWFSAGLWTFSTLGCP